MSDIFDAHVDMYIVLPRGDDGELKYAKVNHRAAEHDGKPLRTDTNDTITDTHLYEVEYLERYFENLPSNVIEDNTLSHVD